MAEFLTGDALNDKVYEIIWKAEDTLLIVSPFIKLDDYFKKLFEHHEHKPKLHILVVFGKNESQPLRSLRRGDFEFFKKFKNLSIIYCEPLHAKYFANEKEGVLTSINLYDYSFSNNIEYGTLFPVPRTRLSGKSAEEQAFDFTMELIEKHPAVYIKRPVYEKKLFSKNYLESKVLYDATDKILVLHKWKAETKKFIQDFPEEIKANEYQERPERPEEEPQVKSFQYNRREAIKPEIGYCIRTGKSIPYDTSRPMCIEAFQSWNQFKNKDFPEKYCHKTGKPSNGKTSLRYPVLR